MRTPVKILPNESNMAHKGNITSKAWKYAAINATARQTIPINCHISFNTLSIYKLTDLSKVESEGEYGVNATTLSGEYGYRKTLKNNLYIEPQAEIIYGHLNSTDYTTKYLWKNWNVHMDGVNHFVTRLGIAVGKSYGSGSYYAKTSYYHDFGGAGSLTYGVYPYSDVALRDWCEITLGGETKVAKNMVLYGEVTKYLGDVTNNLDFNAGLRWNF